MVRLRQPGLLLGEWACLGALASGQRHGFAVAKRLAPDGDLGRIWTLSRPLTYRALATLTDLELIRAVGQEPGSAGPNRTVLALTRSGRAALRAWLVEPVAHPRDVRSELLLKITIADEIGLDRAGLVDAQRDLFTAQRALRERELAHSGDDPVALWRLEFASAAIRFLDALGSAPSDRSAP